MKITLGRGFNGTSLTMSEHDYDVLSHTSLKGCPFTNYNAIDLLHDLILMYDWKIKPGTSCSIDEFLNLCNDVHAEVYRNIYLQEA